MTNAQVAAATILVAVAGPIGFLLTASVLHTFWPIFGAVAYLDFGLAVILSVALILVLRLDGRWLLVAPLAGLVCGAWVAAWLFRGTISI